MAFAGPMSALAIGLAAGIVCYLTVAKVKARFGYNDSLDAFGVHGVGGTLGALLTGVFASSAINPVFKDLRAMHCLSVSSTVTPARFLTSLLPWESPGLWPWWEL